MLTIRGSRGRSSRERDACAAGVAGPAGPRVVAGRRGPGGPPGAAASSTPSASPRAAARRPHTYKLSSPSLGNNITVVVLVSVTDRQYCYRLLLFIEDHDHDKCYEYVVCLVLPYLRRTVCMHLVYITILYMNI